MPLTTGTFNLLSKTKSGHRTGRAVSVERAKPEGRSRVLETCQLFSRTLQTYRAALLPVNTGNHLTPFTYECRLVAHQRTRSARYEPLSNPTRWSFTPAGSQLARVAQGRESLNFVKNLVEVLRNSPNPSQNSSAIEAPWPEQLAWLRN
jgi:hypothetical protein